MIDTAAGSIIIGSGLFLHCSFLSSYSAGDAEKKRATKKPPSSLRCLLLLEAEVGTYYADIINTSVAKNLLRIHIQSVQDG